MNDRKKDWPITPQDVLRQVKPLPPEEMKRMRDQAAANMDEIMERAGATIKDITKPPFSDGPVLVGTGKTTINLETFARAHRAYVKRLEELRDAVATWAALKDSTTCRCHVDPDTCQNHAADVELYNRWEELSR